MCTLSSKGHITHTANYQCKFTLIPYVLTALWISKVYFLIRYRTKSRPQNQSPWLLFPFCITKSRTLNAIFILWENIIQTGFVEMVFHVTVYLHTACMNLAYVWHIVHFICLGFMFRYSCYTITNALQISIVQFQAVLLIIRNRISMRQSWQPYIQINGKAILITSILCTISLKLHNAEFVLIISKPQTSSYIYYIYYKETKIFVFEDIIVQLLQAFRCDNDTWEYVSIRNQMTRKTRYQSMFTFCFESCHFPIWPFIVILMAFLDNQIIWNSLNKTSRCLQLTDLSKFKTSHLYTVYPKKYAHGFCFAVLCCGYTLTDFPISIRLTSLALWQSNDCPSASKATLMNMDKYFMWIHYEWLHNHNKAKHKTVCIFLGIYCIAFDWRLFQ